MLTPSKLDKLPDNMVALMSELQDEIISDLCRRIAKANMLTPTAEWQLYKANQLRLSSSEVNKIIAGQLKKQKNTVKELYTDAVKTAINEDAKVYRMAIAEGKLDGGYSQKLSSFTRSAAFSNALKQGLKNTNGLMRNLTNSAAATANRMLSDELDLAYMKTVSGAFTSDKAVYDAVCRLGNDGIKVISYASGHSDQLDVAVRRAVLTGINKTCCDMQLNLAEEMDCGLVEVSSHFGARPSHAEWQGQIYSLKKGHPKYKYFYDATGYGRGDGLGGWNCRHSFFPFFERLSEAVNKSGFTKEENLQAYIESQKQRGYERAIRKSKRELAALDSARSGTVDPLLKAKLDSQFERKSVILKKRETRLNDFLKQTGNLPDSSRVRVAGFNKSVSQKAVWVDKKALTSKANGGIIKAGGKSIMDTTGASGAIPRSDIVRQNQHAVLYYEEVRKRTNDINSISENTGFSKENIKSIKEHIFFNKYDLGDESPSRFDPDYDMAVSWQRLTEGKNIQEMDLVLLNHELMEYKLMNEKGLTYREAHEITEKTYNYKKYIDELDRRDSHE